VSAWFLHNKIFASLTRASSCLSFPRSERRSVGAVGCGAERSPRQPLRRGGCSPRPCSLPVRLHSLKAHFSASFWEELQTSAFIGGLWQLYRHMSTSLLLTFEVVCWTGKPARPGWTPHGGRSPAAAWKGDLGSSQRFAFPSGFFTLISNSNQSPAAGSTFLVADECKTPGHGFPAAVCSAARGLAAIPSDSQ